MCGRFAKCMLFYVRGMIPARAPYEYCGMAIVSSGLVPVAIIYAFTLWRCLLLTHSMSRYHTSKEAGL